MKYTWEVSDIEPGLLGLYLPPAGEEDCFLVIKDYLHTQEDQSYGIVTTRNGQVILWHTSKFRIAEELNDAKIQPIKQIFYYEK